MPGRDYFLKGRTDETLKVYEKLAIDIADELGANRDRSRQDMTAMIDFEIQLANVSCIDKQHTISI